MLTISTTENRVPRAQSPQLKTAPGIRGSKPPADRVELGQKPIAQAPQNGNAMNWATAGLAAVAVLGASTGAAAQVAPPQTSLVIEDTTQVTVDPSQPLSARQLEDMKWATEFPANSNARAQEIGETYTRLVDRVTSEAQRFGTMVPKIQQMAGEVGSLGFSAHLNGEIVIHNNDGGVKTTNLISVLGDSYKLTERENSISLEHDGITTTLYTQSGFFHEAGDLVIRGEGETLGASARAGTAIQRESGIGESALFETFEKPMTVITIYPGPTFTYEARGAQELSVVVRQDGSTRVKENGEWRVELPKLSAEK